MLRTFQPCATIETLRNILNATVIRLSVTTCTLAGVAGGPGNRKRHSPFRNLKQECETLHAEILVMKQKIATHHDEHGC